MVVGQRLVVLWPQLLLLNKSFPWGRGDYFVPRMFFSKKRRLNSFSCQLFFFWNFLPTFTIAHFDSILNVDLTYNINSKLCIVSKYSIDMAESQFRGVLLSREKLSNACLIMNHRSEGTLYWSMHMVAVGLTTILLWKLYFGINCVMGLMWLGHIKLSFPPAHPFCCCVSSTF